MEQSQIESIILSLPVLLLAFSVHEFMHAWVALKQGDDTAYMLGRVTLDPRVHIDPIGSILFPLIGAMMGAPVIGWAKPTPTNPRKYRRYKRGDVLVSLAGVFGNFLLVLMFALLHVAARYAIVATGGAGWAHTADALFAIGVQLNFFLIVFNLLPVPPLDGAHVMYHLLPTSLAHAYRQIYPYGFVVLYALVFMRVLDRLFDFVAPIGQLFLIPGFMVG